MAGDIVEIVRIHKDDEYKHHNMIGKRVLITRGFFTRWKEGKAKGYIAFDWQNIGEEGAYEHYFYAVKVRRINE